MDRCSIRAILTGVRAMRCMACGAEMILTNVVQDDMMGVPGFEHQTFMCSECHDLERRFVFTKQDRDGDGEPMPEQASPSVAPASTVHEEHVTVIDPAENVLVESTQVAPLELTQTAPVKTTVQVETSQMEPTIQNRDPEPALHQAPPHTLSRHRRLKNSASQPDLRNLFRRRKLLLGS